MYNTTLWAGKLREKKPGIGLCKYNYVDGIDLHETS
jgi:hypothetical protein